MHEKRKSALPDHFSRSFNSTILFFLQLSNLKKQQKTIFYFIKLFEYEVLSVGKLISLSISQLSHRDIDRYVEYETATKITVFFYSSSDRNQLDIFINDLWTNNSDRDSSFSPYFSLFFSLLTNRMKTSTKRQNNLFLISGTIFFFFFFFFFFSLYICLQLLHSEVHQNKQGHFFLRFSFCHICN